MQRCSQTQIPRYEMRKYREKICTLQAVRRRIAHTFPVRRKQADWPRGYLKSVQTLRIFDQNAPFDIGIRHPFAEQIQQISGIRRVRAFAHEGEIRAP